MSSRRSLAGIALLSGALATPVLAQTTDHQPATPLPATRPMDPTDLRRHIYVMEGALAKAVEYGARRLSREIRSAMPEIMALSGEPQARGVYLEGYGVYFDVAVPVLNQVMMWSLRTMMGPDPGTISALNQLKAYVLEEKNPTRRASLERWVEQIELQLGPIGGADSNPFAPTPPQSANAVGAAVLGPDKPAADAATESVLDRKFLDPNAINRAYTESVQDALVDTIIDYAIPTAIKPTEFLTVAARDNMPRDTLAPQDPYVEVVTVLISVRGSDLAAYRAGQIDAAEVRRRIQIREQ